METLEKNEFLAFLFLYAAAADQVLTQTEVEMIAEKVGKDRIRKAKSQFDNFSDYERIEFILAHKQLYFPNEEQKVALLDELKNIFLADKVFSVPEQNLFRSLNRLM
jgi:hypothetical protein